MGAAVRTLLGSMIVATAIVLSGGGYAAESCITDVLDDVDGTEAQLCMAPSDASDPTVGWWGSEFRAPHMKPITLEVTFKGQSIPMPISSYRDLGDARLLEMTIAGDVLEISIRGSDAGGSYTALIKVRDGLVRERIVRHNGFPQDRFDITTFTYNE